MNKKLNVLGIIILAILLIFCLVICVFYFSSNDVKLVQSNITEISYTDNENYYKVKNIPKKISDSYISIINSIESLRGESYKYKLAYINDDDIPELIINDPGYSIGIIVYLNGEFYSMAEHGLSKKIENNKLENTMQLEMPLVYGSSNIVSYNYAPKENTIICNIHNPIISRLEIYDVHQSDLNFEYSLSATRFDKLIYSNLEEFSQKLSELENKIKQNSTYADNFSEKYYLNNKQISKAKYDVLANNTSYSLEANSYFATDMIEYLTSIAN